MLSRLGFLKSSLCVDRHLEALLVLRLLAPGRIPLFEGDLVGEAGEHGSDSNGIVKWRSSGDAESIAVLNVPTSWLARAVLICVCMLLSGKVKMSYNKLKEAKQRTHMSWQKSTRAQQAWSSE